MTVLDEARLIEKLRAIEALYVASSSACMPRMVRVGPGHRKSRGAFVADQGATVAARGHALRG